MKSLFRSTTFWITFGLVLLFIIGSSMAQQQQSGGSGSAVSASQTGNWSMRMQDGSGAALTSTSSALDINIKSGSIANTAFALNAGTALIGTTLPKTGCGTTAYDSHPTNLPDTRPDASSGRDRFRFSVRRGVRRRGRAFDRNRFRNARQSGGKRLGLLCPPAFAIGGDVFLQFV